MLTPVLLGLAVWGALALYYQLPLNETARVVIAGVWGLLALAAVVGLFAARFTPALYGFGAAFLGLMVWWSLILPSNTRDWTAELTHTVSAEINGDRVRVNNVRDFSWRSETDFTPRWESRDYDLKTLTSLDTYAVYWMGPAIAHTIVSFGFEDGRTLAFSIEIRKEKGEVYSPWAGFFKTYELAFIAADERDLIGLRQVRGEDQRLFRGSMEPERIRALFLNYLKQGNALQTSPRFYHTVTANCTTVIFTMLREIIHGIPLDYRVVASGYVPDYLYELQSLDMRYSLADLRKMGEVAAHYPKGELDSVAFSRALRAHLP